MQNTALTDQVTFIRDSNKWINDKPFHLDVRHSFCEAHLQLAGSTFLVQTNGTFGYLYISLSTTLPPAK